MEKNNGRGIRLQRSRTLRKLSQVEFGKKIDAEQPYVAKMEKLGGFSYEQAERFAEVLQINPQWLYFGYGDQFSVLGDEVNEIDENLYKKNNEEFNGVPYYDIEVTGSIVRSFSDSNMKPDFFVDFPPFNDCTAWLPIVGDSMFPRFQKKEKPKRIPLHKDPIFLAMVDQRITKHQEAYLIKHNLLSNGK